MPRYAGNRRAMMPSVPETIVPQITASAGLAEWLITSRTSFAFTSYQTGQLFLVGARADRTISVNQQNYRRAMGLAVHGNRIVLASQFQLWTLENMLRPGKIAHGGFDAA